jgi:hypothetical protein
MIEMAANLPKLPPEPVAPATDAPKTVHVVAAGDGWAIRAAGRVEATFTTRGDAIRAAMPFARKRAARLFVHYAGGEIREASTDPTDELLLEIWHDVRTHGLITSE